MDKADRITGSSLTPQAVYEIARTYGYRAGLRVAPHDLRRTFAKLAYSGGASLEQIKYALGHAAMRTKSCISVASRICGMRLAIAFR